jgi:hypothetical protein
MPDAVAAAIGTLVDTVDGILEAHLPQCFVPGVMESPAQVLVIVVNSDPEVALGRVGQGVEHLLPAGMHLDIWPLKPDSAVLNEVRRANCRVAEMLQVLSLGGVLDLIAPANTPLNLTGAVAT